jgi:hypothetical protein
MRRELLKAPETRNRIPAHQHLDDVASCVTPRALGRPERVRPRYCPGSPIGESRIVDVVRLTPAG